MKHVLLFLILFFLSSTPVFADISIVLRPDPPNVRPGIDLHISIGGFPVEDHTYTLTVKDGDTTITSLPVTITAGTEDDPPTCEIGAASSDAWKSPTCDGSGPFGMVAFLDVSKIGVVPRVGDVPFTLELSDSGVPPLQFAVRTGIASTCAIGAGEDTCPEGVCKSTQYDCVDGHPCYNDEFKNASTSCAFQPKTPNFHCDTTRSCAGAITCWVSTRPDPVTTADETANITVDTSGLSDSIEYWVTLNGQFIRQDLNYIAGRQVAFKPKEGVMEIKNVNTLGVRDPVAVLQQRTFEKKTYDVDILDSSTGRSLCKASFVVGAANYLIKCDPTDAECKKCLGENPASPAGIPTPWGTCFSTNAAGLIGGLFGVILGLAGGIALILIIYSGYRMMVSAGNPEALQGARETLTSAVVGLLFIIFSFVILEVIGVDILKIPSFGKVLAPQSVRENCQDHAFALNNMGKCGSDWAKVICKDKLDAIEDDRATEKDREIWKLCISKGITRFD